MRIRENLNEYQVPKDTTIAVELGEDDILVEMANLSPEQTGIDGFVFISTTMASHGPRVKFYRKLGRNQPSYSVSISDPPRLLANSLPVKVVKATLPSVVAWVGLNRDALLEFWHHGDTWNDARVTAFKAALRKI